MTKDLGQLKRRGGLIVGMGLAVLWATGCRTLSPEPARPLNVLFIGNSYTYANNLPAIFGAIAVSAGFPKPVVAMSAPGGCTLVRHIDTPKTRELIGNGAPSGAPWDVVILQEQSQVPAWAAEEPDMRRMFLAGSDGLVRAIRARSPDALVVFYETWARAPQHWERKSKEVEKAGRDQSEMQQRLRRSYEEMAANAVTNHVPGSRGRVMIARVGDMWEQNFSAPQPLALHGGDGAHPSFAGSYLAGLVLFANIYGKSPAGVRYDGTLSSADAARLRKLVASHRRLAPCEVKPPRGW